MSHQVAIVGAGPYGLAVAAHLRSRGVGFRIFGDPMGSWRHNMPAGMFLKSEGSASSISDPARSHTLGRYCADHGLPYADAGLPVPIGTFVSYGLWFARTLVPDLEQVQVSRIAPSGGAFEVSLATGETMRARAVVVASGLTDYAHIPSSLAGLPSELVSHPSEHADLSRFAGRDVTVVGAGQSALESAALLHEAGASVRVLVRRPEIEWNSGPPRTERRLRERMRMPGSGLGNGWSLWLSANAAPMFRHCPAGTRIRLVRETLGPAGAWWLRERLDDGVPMHLATRVESASVRDGRAHLRLANGDGPREVATDHVLAATGYRPDVSRIPFLAPDLAGRLRRVGGAPALSARFESSVPGLHFVGLSAAHTFGPVCRFVVGSEFTARRLSRHLAHAR
jgi:cation diffusion facilitator CzcD-associated flavoprotein CzcO